MDRTLNVDSEALRSVGGKLIEVAGSVREIYTNLGNTVNAVTSNSSWSGAASSAFLEKFEAIKPEFEKDLGSLEQLGPKVIEVANSYEATEADNVAGM